MRVIIMAAGHGKRMGHELPKPLVPLAGKAIISYLLDSIAESGVCNDPIIVVSPTNIDVFREHLGPDYNYVLQHEQLGTAHAVMAAEEALAGSEEPIFILNGDHPWVSAETIKAVAEKAPSAENPLTMATTVVPDFEGWRGAFYSFGRIVRNDENKVQDIVELRDATDEQKAIHEVNPQYLCFEPDWMWKHIKQVKNNNNQEEYYLTSLIPMLFEEGYTIRTVQIDPKEALGINTKEHLELCEQVAEEE
jgi:bifunctional UDP-N-acetylglucosamine pyrophosphorylase/glucosamine-1-phosphate N-acetyltransferase